MPAQNENVKVAGTDISLGVTLYSFTNEWWTRRYNLEALVAAVTERGVGPGVEMVGFQSIRSFPDVTEDFIAQWRGLIDTYGIVPTCLGANVDVALPTGRFLTEDENVEYLNRQLVTAGRLGFHTVRTQIGAPPRVMERCLPTAEKYEIKMGVEVHAPDSPRTPAIQKFIEYFKKVDSPFLGFIPDFSSNMRANPKGLLASLVQGGFPQGEIENLVAAWSGCEGGQFDRLGQFLESARQRRVSEEALSNCMTVFTMNGREPIEAWADPDFADRIVHVHGKCYEFDDNGDEPSIDYPAEAATLVNIGYKGWISTEWEGHSYLGLGEADAFENVVAQQKLLRRSINQAVGAKV